MVLMVVVGFVTPTCTVTIPLWIRSLEAQET
jgi:hypothetical protein